MRIRSIAAACLLLTTAIGGSSLAISQQTQAQPGHHPSPLPSSHPAAKSTANPPTTVTAEGTWTPLANQVPENVGLMMLLTDGTVVASGNNGTNSGTGGDNTWYKLTPDSTGHYTNGTWSQLASMDYARLYVLSQVLQNGKVFIAGGEYGNAPKGSSELYDPIANTWTELPNTTSIEPNASYIDGESMLLPNGNVLAYSVGGQNCQAGGYYTGDLFIYNVAANSFSLTGCPIGNQDETSWIKLADNSILALDLNTNGNATPGPTSERYIPSTGQWIADAVPPAYIYNVGAELGGAFLLPNGNVFYIGGNNQTLIYTPSGTTAPGTWALGPTVPDEGGQAMGANDAPAAMMVNGKILMAEGCYGSACDYGAPTYFFVYDYQTNTITSIAAPDGTASTNASPFTTDMLDLPDGSVLFEGASQQLYTFTPNSAQIDAGKPVINSVKQNPDGSYLLTGTGFNGISSGADYGDENQNATNYPIASLTDTNGNVYYARTFNWSNTGVSTGSQVVTTDMTVPAGLPHGTYQLTVSANGILSAPNTFNYLLAQTVTLSPNSLTFPLTTVGGRVPGYQQVTLTNNGSTTLNITSVALAGTNASSFFLPSYRQLCNTVTAGGSCTFYVGFNPTTAGSLSATVQITDNAGTSPQTVSLSGTAVNPPAVSLSPSSLTFPSTAVGGRVSGYQEVTLTNTGGETLNITSVAVAGTNATSFFLPSYRQLCGRVAAGGSCTFYAAFQPTTTGALSAIVQITDNAAGSPQVVTLSGTGK